jgi:drug/metabolite transporter (DMT)-like permease
VTLLNLGILLALACAVATQLGFLYKHKGANAAPQVCMRHPLRSARQLFSSRWFASRHGVATGAWFFHVAALAFAPLSVVQAVLSTGVVILAVLADRLFGFEVGARQWIGVAHDRARPAAARDHAAREHRRALGLLAVGMLSFEAGMLGSARC